VTRRRVVIEEPVSLSLGKYLDDPAGLGEVLEVIDALADEPRPAGSVPWGSARVGFTLARTGSCMRSKRQRSGSAAFIASCSCQPAVTHREVDRYRLPATRARRSVCMACKRSGVRIP